MAFAAPLMMAASAVQAVGQLYQGYSQKRQFDAASANATANARNTMLQSSANEDSQRRENRQRMGYARAAAVESGFDASSGSLLNLQVRSAQEMELDTLTERYSNELQALSFRNEAASLKSQGRASMVSGVLNAAGTLFQGGAMAGYGQGPKVPQFQGYGGRY